MLEVEIATFDWANRWSTIRMHQALDYHTPIEAKNNHCHIANTSEKTKTRAKA